MAAVDRTLSDVLHDIIGNIQEMMRSEVRLVKTELREQAVSAKPWALLIGAGVVTAMFATLFVLLTAVFSLALVLPLWTATLIVGVALGAGAAVMIARGAGRFKRLYHVNMTSQPLGEGRWTKQQIR